MFEEATKILDDAGMPLNKWFTNDKFVSLYIINKKLTCELIKSLPVNLILIVY